MAEENDTQKPSREAVAQVSVDSAPVVKQFVECPSCGKLWPYDGHAADVCCGKCSHNFYVPPDAITRRLIACESVLRSVVQNVPIMCRGFRATLLHSQCAGLVGEQNAIGAADTDGIRHERHERQSGGDLSSANDL